LKLSLKWPIDLSGYHLEEERAGKTLSDYALSEPPGPSIVRNGGKMESHDVMQIAALYNRLADCSPDEKGALKFVSKFGFLSSKNARSERVENISKQIEVVRSLVGLRKSEDWEQLEDWMMEHSKAFRLNPEFYAGDAGDPPKMFFAPSSLIDAIYLQFFQDISTEAKFKLCKRPGCGEWFSYGPGIRDPKTGKQRRETAEYCSPGCQKQHAYANSKVKSKKRGRR
jgi:hypothetical protein